MRAPIAWTLAAMAALSLALPARALAKEKDEAATVTCKDGTTSKAGRGACSGHGGVDRAASAKAGRPAAKDAAEAKGKKAERAKKAKAEDREEPAKRAKADDRGAQVVCKDGTTSRAGRGACSGHGGVEKGASKTEAGARGSAAGMPRSPPAEPPAAPPAPPAATPPAPRAPASAAEAPAARRSEPRDEEKGPPTARCRDGSLSYAKHHSGACSSHGGVAEWLDQR